MSIRWSSVLIFILGFIILGFGIGWIRSSNTFLTTFLSLMVMFGGILLIGGAYQNLSRGSKFKKYLESNTYVDDDGEEVED